jgi:uncharacterized protein (DUF4415 family)
MSMRPKIKLNSPEEEAQIVAAALADPDALPLTEDELAKFQPRRPRGRPTLPATKIPTNLRLDPVVIGAFKATGDGWQTRINDALLEYVKTHGMVT